jgi:hypothetical protein
MRRVLLLETDERAGLAAAITSACTARHVSLEITSGPGHVLITFDADDDVTRSVVDDLKNVSGVDAVYPYEVAI